MVLRCVPDHLKTKKMCEKAVEAGPWLLYHVPDCFKTEKMCERAVAKSLWALEYVPDQFVAQGQIKLWDDDHCNDNKPIKWQEGYKKRKTQKARIKEELMPITWHPSRWWDWCVPEDEKGDAEKLWT